MQTPPIELPEAYVWCDPDPLGGKPCFRGTRVIELPPNRLALLLLLVPAITG